ncbi:MAG: type II toxin-antitoxin system RelE/ParE family toxin [bacterium]|nr:type II toxin-antitoxin system RelE/ParE family toxin [bacterium]
MKITVVELPEYRKKIKNYLDEAESEQIVDYIASNPRAGVLIKGTGRLRKIRWARKGMGKSGGIRVIYYYYNEGLPTFLITAFGKNEKENLSKNEQNELAKLTTLLVESYERGKK